MNAAQLERLHEQMAKLGRPIGDSVVHRNKRGGTPLPPVTLKLEICVAGLSPYIGLCGMLVCVRSTIMKQYVTE